MKSLNIGDKVSFLDYPDEILTVTYTDEYGFTTDNCLVQIPWNELEYYEITEIKNK